MHLKQLKVQSKLSQGVIDLFLDEKKILHGKEYQEKQVEEETEVKKS